MPPGLACIMSSMLGRGAGAGGAGCSFPRGCAPLGSATVVRTSPRQALVRIFPKEGGRVSVDPYDREKRNMVVLSQPFDAARRHPITRRSYFALRQTWTQKHGFPKVCM